MGRQRDEDAGQRADIMLEPLEQEAVQVGEVAGDVDLLDLALPVAEVLESRDQPFDDQHALAEGRAGADHRPARLELLGPGYRVAKHLLLALGDIVARAKLEQQPVDGIAVTGHRDSFGRSPPPGARLHAFRSSSSALA
jgi:hypothetical protein